MAITTEFQQEMGNRLRTRTPWGRVAGLAALAAFPDKVLIFLLYGKAANIAKAATFLSGALAGSLDLGK